MGRARVRGRAEYARGRRDESESSQSQEQTAARGRGTPVSRRHCAWEWAANMYARAVAGSEPDREGEYPIVRERPPASRPLLPRACVRRPPRSGGSKRGRVGIVLGGRKGDERGKGRGGRKGRGRERGRITFGPWAPSSSRPHWFLPRNPGGCESVREPHEKQAETGATLLYPAILCSA